MRTPLSNIRTVLLFVMGLVVSVAAYGQCPSSLNATLTPVNLPIGTTTPVVATGNFPVVSGCSYQIASIIDSSGNADPNLTITNFVATSNRFTFNAVVGSGDTPKTDYIGFGCSSCDLVNYVAVNIVANCPTPTITSIGPQLLFAGNTYSITLTGTNFITSSAATASCPVTPVSITSTSGLATVSNVSVVSSTQITLSLVTAWTEPLEQVTFAAGTATANHYIFPVPIISYNGTPISTTGASVPTALIGQKVTLTETPTTLPSGYSITRTGWTVGGSNIGGYTVVPPTNSAPLVSSASTTPTVLSGTTLSTYWTAAATRIPVTYQYCAAATGGVSQCSRLVTAYVTAAGPTGVSVVTSGKTFSDVYDPPETLEWNIDFTATATSPSSAAGVYSWVQLIPSISDVEYFSDGSQKTCTTGTTSPALDTSYPFDTGLETGDPPADRLSLANETGANDTQNFKMYFMWNPKVDASSIPISLGYITWTATGTVTYNASTSTWGGASGSTTASTFTTSSTEPLWQVAVTGTSISANCK